MQVKTYTAATKLEALLKIREELGPDAVILDERKVQKGGLFFKKPAVEIVVALKEEAEPVQKSVPAGKKAEPKGVDPRGVEPKGVEDYDPVQTRLRRLEYEMQEVRTLMRAVHHRLQEENSTVQTGTIATLPAEHPLLRPLTASGVEPELARELLARIPSSEGEIVQKEHLRRIIERAFQVGGVIPKERTTRQVVALIGPTGVGKTTTIAKLAALHALDYNKKVGLISLDTYRIGAIDQLRTYAEIMDVPLQIAYNAGELAEGLNELQQCDLVLIDTIGRSQRDETHLKELHSALLPAGATPYLTLSATADSHVLMDVAERFAPFKPAFYLLTKVDEAVRFGNLLNLFTRNPLPIAYCTDGQRVPEDIHEANPSALAKKVF